MADPDRLAAGLLVLSDRACLVAFAAMVLCCDRGVSGLAMQESPHQKPQINGPNRISERYRYRCRVLGTGWTKVMALAAAFVIAATATDGILRSGHCCCLLGARNAQIWPPRSGRPVLIVASRCVRTGGSSAPSTSAARDGAQRNLGRLQRSYTPNPRPSRRACQTSSRQPAPESWSPRPGTPDERDDHQAEYPAGQHVDDLEEHPASQPSPYPARRRKCRTPTEIEYSSGTGTAQLATGTPALATIALGQPVSCHAVCHRRSP